ncbi:hypothetical protein [Streptomyces sp. NPDC001985]|uniref:hypothetical protein n=1 Tax=Streptomyces sp. NPDC001985 TaxID=3154406 RepID=UPI00331DB767
MHGPGHVPQQPGSRAGLAALIALRVLFVAMSIGTLGLLSWAPMLRIAILRRQRSDWLLFWGCLVVVVVCFVMIGDFSAAESASGAEATATGIEVVFLLVLMAVMLGVPVHYLVAEIRHYQQPAPHWGPPPPPYGMTAPAHGPPAQPPAGYGYPHAVPQGPHRPAPPAHPPYAPPPHGASPYTSPPPPPPPRSPRPGVAQQPPAADKPRIAQVRAELDELSDYLRKERGR